jgi:type VII secretion protein EccB
MMKRLERAFGRRDVRDINEPLSVQSAYFRWGLAAIALMAIAAFVVGLLFPAGKAGTANFIALKSGGRYVKYDNQWHSVPNLASARLILNSPSDAKSVSDSELVSLPIGPPMGIPVAPDALSVTDEEHVRWSVCSTQSAESSASSATDADVLTTVIGGTALNSRARQVQGGEAVIVTTVDDPNTFWLVFDGHRAVLPGAPEIRNALGVSEENMQSAAVVSRAVLNAIPQYPTITAPSLDRLGEKSSKVGDWLVGTVLRTRVGDEKTTYVVADDGVQVVSETIARLLINSGSDEVVDAPMSVISRVATVGHISVDQFPARPPLIISDRSVCPMWEQDGTKPSSLSVYVADTLPLDESQKPVTLLTAKGATVTADEAYVSPGTRWLLRIVGADNATRTGAQKWFLDSNGIRYAIGQAAGENADPLKALGIKGDPRPIPWSIAQLFTEGAQLSFANALVYHDKMPDSPNQQAAPRNEDDMAQGGQ